MTAKNNNGHGSIHFLPKNVVTIDPFPTPGRILDIGGGGEGVIGQLLGDRVVAIDPSRRELQEAPEGPLKIVMDGRELQFLDGSFQLATAFFTMMYIPVKDHKRIFEEVHRVLAPGGRFLVWDADIPMRSKEEEELVAVHLEILLPGKVIETGYGTRWPEADLNSEHYLTLAAGCGFNPQDCQLNNQTFFLEIEK